jgi:hypothetical protein
MIEKLVRWLIKVFLPGWHLHRDRGPKLLPHPFLKEKTDGDESIFTPGSAGRSINS